MFTPNWKISGFKSADEGMLHAIRMLMDSFKTKGLDGDSVVTWRNTTFKIGLGKKKEKKGRYGNKS